MVRQGHRLLTGPGGLSRLCEVKNAHCWRRGYPPIAFMFRGLAHACFTQGMYPTPSGFFQTDWRMYSESSSSLPPLRIIGLRSLYSVSKRHGMSVSSDVRLTPAHV